jgi:cytochrome b561
MLNNTPTAYGTLSKLLHWLLALILASLLIMGSLHLGDAAVSGEARQQAIGPHAILGLIFLLLTLLRIGWILRSPPPPLPSTLLQRERIVIKGVQGLLYILMLILPLSGYLMASAAGYPLPLPTIIAPDAALAAVFRQIHHFSGLFIIALIALHLASTLRNRLRARGSDRDILSRML